jgi:hypothetical protein
MRVWRDASLWNRVQACESASTVWCCSLSSLSPSVSLAFVRLSVPLLSHSVYGDMGHGTMLFLFALYLLWNEEKFLGMSRRGEMSEIPSMVFGGRYLLVMMGFFAAYSGTIYNDLFSNPVNIFGTHWSGNETAGIDAFDGKPYPYGIDPAWYHTTNELAFFNSMKMKLAVTLGVTQMTFGICLGALNDIYFGDRLALVYVDMHGRCTRRDVRVAGVSIDLRSVFVRRYMIDCSRICALSLLPLSFLITLSLLVQVRVPSSFRVHHVHIRLHGVHHRLQADTSMGSRHDAATVDPDDDTDVLVAG